MRRAVDAVGDRVHGGDAEVRRCKSRGSIQVPPAVALAATESGAGKFEGCRSAAAHYILNAHAGTTPPLAFLAVALNTCVPPTSSDTLLAGLSVTLDTPALAGLLLLLPRQPVRMAARTSVKVRTKPNCNDA